MPIIKNEGSMRTTTHFKWVRSFFDLIMRHDILSMSSSLAYYTVLSITPFLLLIFATMNFVGWNNFPEFQNEMVKTLGPTMGTAMQSIQDRLNDGGAVVDFGVFTFLTFTLSAMGIIAELQRSLNMILFGYSTNKDASTREAIIDWLQTRAITLVALVFCVAVVVGSFALAVAFRFFIQSQNEMLWEVVRFVASFLIFSGVFFFLFRYLPMKRQSVDFSARAGVICSTLFHIGKYIIESYFLRVDMRTGYGALSSFVLLLLWAYYNALIIVVSTCAAKALFYNEDKT